jgi:hypothetical protein
MEDSEEALLQPSTNTRTTKITSHSGPTWFTRVLYHESEKDLCCNQPDRVSASNTAAKQVCTRYYCGGLEEEMGYLLQYSE